MKARVHTKAEPEYFVTIEDIPVKTVGVLRRVLASIGGSGDNRNCLRDLSIELRGVDVPECEEEPTTGIYGVQSKEAPGSLYFYE